MFPLYLDDDREAHRIAAALRAQGFDVLRSTDAGMRARSDESHLEFAHEAGRVIYTANGRDFGRLHSEFMREERQHSGIIVVGSQQLGIGEQARRIAALGARYSVSDMVNRIEWIGRRVVGDA